MLEIYWEFSLVFCTYLNDFEVYFDISPSFACDDAGNNVDIDISLFIQLIC